MAGSCSSSGRASAIGAGLTAPGDARPVASAVAEPTPGSAPAASGATGPAAPLPPAEPIALRIPAIDVDTAVFPIGLNPDRTIAVPQPGPQYDLAAWYRYSPTPGELGPSVLEGHLDSAVGRPSVFYRLGSLRPGQEISVDRAEDLTAVFRVTEVRGLPKAEFPTATVYGDLDYPGRVRSPVGGSIPSPGTISTTPSSSRHSAAHPTM